MVPPYHVRLWTFSHTLHYLETCVWVRKRAERQRNRLKRTWCFEAYEMFSYPLNFPISVLWTKTGIGHRQPSLGLLGSQYM